MTAATRRTRNPFRVWKGQLWEDTDRRLTQRHYGDSLRVEKVSFIRRTATVQRGFISPLSSKFIPWTGQRPTEVKLARFSPKSHLRRIPNWRHI